MEVSLNTIKDDNLRFYDLQLGEYYVIVDNPCYPTHLLPGTIIRLNKDGNDCFVSCTSKGPQSGIISKVTSLRSCKYRKVTSEDSYTVKF